jgi:RHS repeat-associated protein
VLEGLALPPGEQNHYYQIDHLGSVRKLTDAAGSVANSYDTDAFGRFETRSETIANPYTFTAREFDPESRLHFYRARYYEPVAGRFISEDTTGFEAGDLNLYRYVFNNPVNFVDPTGQLTLGEHALIAGANGVLFGGANVIVQIKIKRRALEDVNWCEVAATAIPGMVGIGGGVALRGLGGLTAGLAGVFFGVSAYLEMSALCAGYEPPLPPPDPNFGP